MTWTGYGRSEVAASILARLKSAFQKNLFALLAFIIPFTFRSVPEILSWPYPIGFDTVIYIRLILQGWLSSVTPFSFLKGSNLFYLISSLSSELTNNATMVIKFFGPLLLGVLCLMMYVFSVKGLGWEGWKSLLLAVLVATYFVSLRASWDMYRQTLGLIFLMASLISLRSFASPRKYYLVSIFMLLTVMSQELAAVLIFAIVAIECLKLLWKKERKDFVFLAASSVLPFALFIFQRYSPQGVLVASPLANVASGPSVGLALYMVGFLVFCYALISPLVLLGLTGVKDLAMRGWVLVCLSIVFLDLISPNLFNIWFRWVLLLVYPLLFFAVEGLERIWRFSLRSKNKVRRFYPKIFVFIYFALLFSLSGGYIASMPESAFPYFYQLNPYLTSFPSSMLQNTISIKDNPSFANCIAWFNQNTTKGSELVEYDPLYQLGSIYLQQRQIIFVGTDPSVWSNSQNVTLGDKITAAAKNALSASQNQVYTVWWSNGKGWYGLSILPPDFREIYRNGNMAVYEYIQSA